MLNPSAGPGIGPWQLLVPMRSSYNAVLRYDEGSRSPDCGYDGCSPCDDSLPDTPRGQPHGNSYHPTETRLIPHLGKLRPSGGALFFIPLPSQLWPVSSFVGALPRIFPFLYCFFITRGPSSYPSTHPSPHYTCPGINAFKMSGVCHVRVGEVRG